MGIKHNCQDEVRQATAIAVTWFFAPELPPCFVSEELARYRKAIFEGISALPLTNNRPNFYRYVTDPSWFYFPRFGKDDRRGPADFSAWNTSHDTQGLKGPMWLYAYETARTGIVAGTNAAFLQQDPYFSLLLSKNVRFFDIEAGFDNICRRESLCILPERYEF